MLGKKSKNKTSIWEKTKWLRWATKLILPILLGATGSLYLYFRSYNQTDNINNFNSPNSINTVGQNGNNSVTINNNAPNPKITINPIKENIKQNGQYLSEFLMNVKTEIPIPNLYVQANANSIIYLYALPKKTGAYLVNGGSGFTNKEKISFINISNAPSAEYQVTAITNQPEKITFNFKY